MIDHLTLDLQFVNRQLQADDLREFNTLANELVFNHILEPFLEDQNLDSLKILQVMQEEQMNLEELMYNENRARVDISYLERDLTDFQGKAYLLENNPYSLRIVCNHNQAQLLQKFIIAYFPTFDYDTARISDTAKFFRYPVSITPSLVYESISIDPSHPVGAHLEQQHAAPLEIAMVGHLGTRQEEEVMAIAYLQQICDHPEMESYRDELSIDPLIYSDLSITSK